MTNETNPSRVEHGSTTGVTLDEIMALADALVNAAFSRDISEVRSERARLLGMLQYHIGGGEPWAIVKVDGSFIHTTFLKERPNVGEFNVYLAPQLSMHDAKVQALQAFFDAAMKAEALREEAAYFNDRHGKATAYARGEMSRAAAKVRDN